LIKTGAEFIRYRCNTQVASDSNRRYDFLSVRDSLSNNRLASFYADVFYSGDQAMPTGTGLPERGFRQNVAGVYFQDDVR
jgi:polysaccharide pyruvyl transferase WcaK-like protein